MQREIVWSKLYSFSEQLQGNNYRENLQIINSLIYIGIYIDNMIPLMFFTIEELSCDLFPLGDPAKSLVIVICLSNLVKCCRKLHSYSYILCPTFNIKYYAEIARIVRIIVIFEYFINEMKEITIQTSLHFRYLIRGKWNMAMSSSVPINRAMRLTES